MTSLDERKEHNACMTYTPNQLAAIDATCPQKHTSEEEVLYFWGAPKQRPDVRCSLCDAQYQMDDFISTQLPSRQGYFGLLLSVTAIVGVWILPWSVMAKGFTALLCVFSMFQSLWMLWHQRQRSLVYQAMFRLGAPAGPPAELDIGGAVHAVDQSAFLKKNDVMRKELLSLLASIQHWMEAEGFHLQHDLFLIEKKRHEDVALDLPSLDLEEQERTWLTYRIDELRTLAEDYDEKRTLLHQFYDLPRSIEALLNELELASGDEASELMAELQSWISQSKQDLAQI